MNGSIIKRGGLSLLLVAMIVAGGWSSALAKGWDGSRGGEANTHRGLSRYDRVLADQPQLRDFQIPEVARVELDNGLVLYLVEDHDLPLVKISALVRVGGIYEPSSKAGLASLMGTVMRSGGTEQHPGDELDVLLESIGASIETSLGAASGSASMNCLSEHLDQVLPLFADLLRNPAFPVKKLDLAKTQEKSGISRRNDSADDIAWREIYKLYYGESSPYARHPEYDTLDAIERRDLLDFHDYFYHPNNMVMTVGGDFDTAEMIEKLGAVFGDWDFVDTFYPPDPDLEETKAQICYIYKEGVNQSKIRMGHLGVKHDDEHYYALSLLNQILGGGFSSRLFTRVRSREELAYSVFAWMVAGDHHRGPFVIGCDTKSESTLRAIEIIREEVTRVTLEEVSELELQQAKDALKNSFVFKFKSPYSIARRQASFEFWSKDPDFLSTYLARVDAVTPADILAAAQARIYPEAMALLVVGNQDEFDAPLSTLGEVREIDISIPEPSFVAQVLPPITNENLAAGARVFGDALKACGGQAALDAVHGLRIEGEIGIQTPQGEFGFPALFLTQGEDRMRVEMGPIVQVFNGEQGWLRTPDGQVKEMSASEVDDHWSSEGRDLLRLFRRLDSLRLQQIGREIVEGEDCHALWLHEGEHGTKILVSVASSRVVGMEFRDNGEMGPHLNRTLFDNYAEKSGFLFPQQTRVLHDGEPFMTIEANRITVNPDAGEEMFQSP